MKDIEPKVFRQRLLVEAKIDIKVTESVVEDYLRKLAEHLELRIYGNPVVYSTSDTGGKEINQGFDGFVPLIDSGISISVWSSVKFIVVLIHTCKRFEVNRALDFTKTFFRATEIVHKEF